MKIMKSNKQHINETPARKKGTVTKVESDEKPQIEEETGKQLSKQQDKDVKSGGGTNWPEQKRENKEKYKGGNSEPELFDGSEETK
jgi:hypothetical protein